MSDASESHLEFRLFTILCLAAMIQSHNHFFLLQLSSALLGTNLEFHTDTYSRAKRKVNLMTQIGNIESLFQAEMCWLSLFATLSFDINQRGTVIGSRKSIRRTLGRRIQWKQCQHSHAQQITQIQTATMNINWTLILHGWDDSNLQVYCLLSTKGLKRMN